MQLICKDVSLGYENRIVSEAINFFVAQGDCLCSQTETGSGKDIRHGRGYHCVQEQLGVTGVNTFAALIRVASALRTP